MTRPAMISVRAEPATHEPTPLSQEIEGFDTARWQALKGIHTELPWQGLPTHIHRTSLGRPWQGMMLWHQVGPVEDLYVPAQNHCVILLRRGQPTDMTVRIGDVRMSKHWQAGEAFIVPSDQPGFWRSSVVRNNLHISLSPAWLQRAAQTDVTLAACFGRRDPVLMAFADLLLASLDNNVSLQPEFGEHMALCIAMHLVQNYAVFNDRPRAISGLTARQMRDITDQVLPLLNEAWPVERLAAITGLSSFHFSRAFKQSFGKSPHAWVQLQRMELAARLTRDTHLPLTEIAVATGHPSAAHFSHAFRRHWGVTPSHYRRS